MEIRGQSRTGLRDQDKKRLKGRKTSEIGSWPKDKTTKRQEQTGPNYQILNITNYQSIDNNG